MLTAAELSQLAFEASINGKSNAAELAAQAATAYANELNGATS